MNDIFYILEFADSDLLGKGAYRYVAWKMGKTNGNTGEREVWYTYSISTCDNNRKNVASYQSPTQISKGELETLFPLLAAENPYEDESNYMWTMSGGGNIQKIQKRKQRLE